MYTIGWFPLKKLTNNILLFQNNLPIFILFLKRVDIQPSANVKCPGSFRVLQETHMHENPRAYSIYAPIIRCYRLIGP